MLVKTFRFDLNIERIKCKFENVFLLANPSVSTQSVFCSIFYFSSKDIFKQIKLKSTGNQFAAQIETSFEIIEDKLANLIILGIDSASCHYVIMENIKTRQINLSGYVDYAMNSLAWEARTQRVLMAGASGLVSAFEMKDPEYIFELYNSSNFAEIFSIKLIKKGRFFVLTGDSNCIEIVELQSLSLFRRIRVGSDILLFKMFCNKLYFFDDSSYNTISITI